METKGTNAFEALCESELRLRTLVTAGTYSIYRMSPDWRVMYQLDSETLASTADPIEDWVDKYIPEDDRISVLSAIAQAVRTKSLFELEHRVRLADGSPGWVLSRAVPVLDEGGEITEWFGTGKDINSGQRAEAERKRKEAQLRESEQSYHALFAASPVPFIVFAPDPPDFTITGANDAYFAATYSTREQIIGRKVFEVFPDDPTRDQTEENTQGPEILRKMLNGVLASRRPYSIPRTRYDLIDPSGRFEEHWWVAISAPVLDADGQVSAIIHQITDETKLHHAEAGKQKSQESEAFLLRLSDDMRAQPDEDAVGALVVNRLAEYMQLDRCYCARLYSEQDQVVLGPEYRRSNLGPVSGEYRLSDFPESFRIIQRQTAVFNDVVGDPALPETDKRSLGAIDLGALISASVRKGTGEVLWALVVASATSRVWTPGEVALAENVAERTWAAIERARVEAALRESEERYRSLFETINQGFSLAEVVRDVAGNAVDWRLLQMNPVFEVYAGMSVASCVGRTASDVFGGVDPHWLAVYDRVVRSRKEERSEAWFRPINRWVGVNVYPGTGDRFTVLYEDIGERKRAEAALRESEERQAFLLRLSDDIRTQPSEDAIRLLVVNRVAEQLQLDRCYLARLYSEQDRVVLGPEYRRPDLGPLSGEYRLSDFPESFRLLQRQTVVFNDVVGNPSLPDADKRSLGAIDLGALVAASVRQGEERVLWTLVVATAKGRVWTPGEVELVENVAERTWAAIERVRAEAALRESEERLRLFVDNVQEYALMQTDIQGAITTWNTGAERLFGYSPLEVLGRSFSMMFTPEDFESSVFLKELEFVKTGRQSEDARWMVRKDESRFWARWITEPVYETDGRLRGLAKVMRDETDRQRADEVLRVSLAEKEELLREVHHRVKNNLQVIVSLLNLQGRQIDDKRVLAQFQEARNRVLAISSIHELLYRAESFAGIALREYVRQLVPGLIRFYGLESRVGFEFRGDGERLGLERAVPFGMMLNELISNACKHAFPAPKEGSIRVSIEPVDDKLELTVADNGIGLPEGYDYLEGSSLGLKLVHTLARQLRGTVDVISASGTTVKVLFPKMEREGENKQ